MFELEVIVILWIFFHRLLSVDHVIFASAWVVSAALALSSCRASGRMCAFPDLPPTQGGEEEAARRAAVAEVEEFRQDVRGVGADEGEVFGR